MATIESIEQRLAKVPGQAEARPMPSAHEMRIVFYLRRELDKGVEYSDELMAKAKRHASREELRDEAIARGEPDAWKSDIDDPRWDQG